MEWKVIRFNINRRKIESYNVFKHASFYREVAKICAGCPRKQVFAEELRRNAMYYFWSKCAWEVIISEWPPAPPERNVAEKIDVYDQLRMNWEHFVNYVWRHRKELANEYANMD
jgi:hypothetical protein